jgi:hypothetical protein
MVVPADGIDADDAGIDTKNTFRCHTSAVDNNCQARFGNRSPRRGESLPRPAYDSLVRYDAAWHARIARVLSGALDVWGVAGVVRPDPADASAFVVAPRAGPAVRVRHAVPGGWAATLRDPVSGAEVGLGRHAGLPGLLRQLREELAPDAPAGRLVIGAQRILHDDADAR